MAERSKKAWLLALFWVLLLAGLAWSVGWIMDNPVLEQIQESE